MYYKHDFRVFSGSGGGTGGNCVSFGIHLPDHMRYIVYLYNNMWAYVM